MKRFTIVIVFIIPFLTSCWQSHLSKVSMSSNSDSCSVDSLVILYDHNLSIPHRETRRWFEFISVKGKFIRRMPITDKNIVNMIDSCITNGIPIINNRCSDTDYLLLRYRGSSIDTIALESRPGIIEIRDTIYRDSLVWYSVICQLAQSDSIWRTESALGIITYHEYMLNDREEGFSKYYNLWEIIKKKRVPLIFGPGGVYLDDSVHLPHQGF